MTKELSTEQKEKRNARNKAWREKNKAYLKEYSKKPETLAKKNERSKKYNKEHRNERNEYNKEYMRSLKLEKKREYAQRHTKQRRIRLDRYRMETFNAYGGAKCQCCGETALDFLTIDHIKGGGRKHRKEIGTDLVGWLRKNNYPEGFRVLCMNCNFAIRYGKTCPHKRR